MQVPLDEVRAHLRRSRERMLGEWRSLGIVPASAWQWFEESGPLHYREHLMDLRRSAGRRTRSPRRRA